MARRLVFSPHAWGDYLYWQGLDAKILERLNRLLEDCRRDPFKGIGKPEPLKGHLTGCWSRRITDSERLIYRAAGNDIEVIACRYHYRTG